MSQSGIIGVTGGMLPPEVATSYVTNMGIAVPVGNVLNVLGTTVAAGATPFQFTGLGNTVTGQIQISQAIASKNATNIGLAAFNSAQFTVDDGFVSFTGTGSTQTITGNTGTATPVANNINIVTANTTVKFVGSGSTITQNFGLSNLILGANAAAITSAINNVSLGNTNLNALTLGINNTIIGSQSGPLIDQGPGNSVLGSLSLSKVTSGQGNIVIGSSSLINLTTGSFNTIIGTNQGNAYSSTESANILIGAISVTGESNTIKIGSQGGGTQQQNRCFIAGIVGVTNSNTQNVTIDSTTGQLGVTTLTSGTVTSVSGTANRITVTNPTTTPVIDIDAAYVGQTSITTLGTVGTGTWNATNISLAKGGTNASLTASNGGIFYSTATAGAILAGTATAGQILRSGASAAPSWSTTTYPATNAINTLLYASAANTMSALATANNGVLTTSAAGVPAITALGARQFIAANAAGVVAARSFSTVIQVFTASGTYTPTTGMQFAYIEIVGGGGGSGGCAATGAGTFAAAGGGGYAEYAAGMFSATTVGASQTVTIGISGAAGASGGGTGGVGGTTSVGALITAIGGSGGIGSAAASSVINAGGAGGTGGTGGTIRFPGMPGGFGMGSVPAGLLMSGPGGNGRFGGGAAPSGGAGNIGQNFGSGASGSANNLSLAARAGAAGAPGYVAITEYVIN